ncbi:MAG: 3-oxoacyl-[acyl-carrier protein] reductase (3-ketoacyl-acyl carrier protein reductase) [uncultured bacterium]|nr:MAG: 3-oxoacyl-[acyl-carrier protein] reductase (3-ketoacyl-acyl carrier protein reductase) [uncultured bacterium]OGT16160.1 MAG: 3-oxoacyl-ACP reductase [Gammaproteobacteria bacterium RIFCSPHIGHO2_02_FULL_38_33]OGT23507.1 MAG: 3-oxoacyl-ACP reductase [Gammaproteobacteria bacterium RIFCSPHIGHO2_12_38_15]OGT69577.1 MAG: 3-oxoacyl-ACP reductase [Gammaproteobacteria bacterium RIFCSPLOWO2_02_FULL_38_11]OGT75423.1 MAG: 3-oxoacyl-ACP reductase [Gammaproteobacteria bacterium RIFCSPLOWO2_12_FULL_38_
MTMLQGKIALVTGASRGLGKAIAEHLGHQGAFILGTATSEQGCKAIETAFETANIQGKAYIFDQKNFQEVSSFYERIKKEVGAPLILINNAGIVRDNLFLRMKTEEWNDVIDTNLNGVYHLTRACIKEMLRAQWGRIISLSSIVGVTGAAGQANYAAAKAALIGFSKSVAQEVASRNITVNVIAPGYIATDMTNAISQAHIDKILEKIPQGKCGMAEDIAFAAGFLASPQANYITGQTLHVNGGMYMV